jgi:phage-related protein
MKPLSFLGLSLDDVRAFPETARREAGHQLNQVQRGLDPEDWKPMQSIGGGVREIRIRDQAGAFRVIYVATRPEASTCCTPSKRRPRLRPSATWPWQRRD